MAAVIVFQRINGPILLGTTTDEAAMSAAMPMAPIWIAELEQRMRPP